MGGHLTLDGVSCKYVSAGTINLRSIFCNPAFNGRKKAPRFSGGLFYLQGLMKSENYTIVQVLSPLKILLNGTLPFLAVAASICEVMSSSIQERSSL